MTTSNDLFQNAAKDYDLIAAANPYYPQFQQAAAAVVEKHLFANPNCHTSVLRTNMNILELGCGTGLTTAAILDEIAGYRETYNVQLRSVDLQRPYIEAAQSRVKSSWVDLQFVHGDALSVLQNTPPGSVDIVVSAYMLHNIDCVSRQPYFDQISTVLRPGGIAVNADKYHDSAMSERDHQALLGKKFRNYADFFIKNGRFDLLRDVLAHYLHDDLPFMRLSTDSIKHEMEHRGTRFVNSIGTPDIFGLDKVIYWQKR